MVLKKFFKFRPLKKKKFFFPKNLGPHFLLFTHRILDHFDVVYRREKEPRVGVAPIGRRRRRRSVAPQRPNNDGQPMIPLEAQIDVKIRTHQRGRRHAGQHQQGAGAEIYLYIALSPQIRN